MLNLQSAKTAKTQLAVLISALYRSKSAFSVVIIGAVILFFSIFAKSLRIT